MKSIFENITWQFCLIVLLIIIFILYLFWGNKKKYTNPPLSNKISNYSDLLKSLNSINISSDTSSDTSSESSLNDHFILKETNNIVSQGPKQYGDGSRKSKGEQICCKSLEEIYGKSFYTVRPNFLRNPETGRNLELDCYNHEIKIAVEYNGIQHYKWPNFTGQSKLEFENQLRRDNLKRRLCDDNGIYLITVPYNVPHNHIKNYIIHYLPENVQKRLQN